MGKYLTQKVRIEQTGKTRIFRTLDNELYKDNDGTIYIVPRYFQTDNYSIPLWVSVIGGSPVEYRIEPSHNHDEHCLLHKAVYVTLTEEELLEKGYYRFSEKRQLWVCENIPKEYLAVKKISKFQANNMLFRAMRACGTPLYKCLVVRGGVACNLNWYLDTLKHKIPEVDLDHFYDFDYWDFVGRD